MLIDCSYGASPFPALNDAIQQHDSANAQYLVLRLALIIDGAAAFLSDTV